MSGKRDNQLFAALPHGVATRRQLRAAGLTANQVDHRIDTERLTIVHRGVLVAGALTRPGRWLAATLACGPEAVLSHSSAADLWGLLPGGPGPVHVTVPARSGRRPRTDIAVHRCRLEPHETTTRDDIRVTTCARALIDVAPSLSRRELERAVDEAFFLKHVNLNTVRAALARNAQRPGTSALRVCLERHQPGTTRTETELEEAMFTLCRLHSLPQPRCQAWVEGYRVDFFWPKQRLIVETDGWAGHKSRVSFEADRERDVRLRVAGYPPPLRFTHRQITNRPGWVAESLRVELGR